MRKKGCLLLDGDSLLLIATADSGNQHGDHHLPTYILVPTRDDPTQVALVEVPEGAAHLYRDEPAYLSHDEAIEDSMRRIVRNTQLSNSDRVLLHGRLVNQIRDYSWSFQQ